MSDDRGELIRGDWSDAEVVQLPDGCVRVVCYAFLDEPGWTVIAARLPGLASRGDNLVDALNNFKAAAREVLQTYADVRADPPWLEQDQAGCWPDGARRCTLFVEVK